MDHEKRKKAIQQQLEQEQQKAMDEAVHQRQMKEEYKITGEVPEEEPNVPNEPPATPPPAPVSEKPNKFNPPKLAAVDEGDDGAGFELVSVDGVFLQGDTDPHAVDIIHRAFSNKAKDPMMCIVEAPKIP
ncbi:uncharacterized protein LOC121547248 isoform X1 [Coregonus clupeaformis]|uniref:uncharacterized protein LOC121547248 isoform X1 n=2 Tax=Coregonus clupeaformis TaxID=59861 RepID=UPI001BDF7D0B|nr:uncharacterized protein LOC121547248 isoform X1 [Coregonus clupeaformis]